MSRQKRVNLPAALLLTGLLLMFSVTARAWDDYVGWSGAPGTPGLCAYSCHGPMGGTIYVQGFPDNYVPGVTYTVKVGHAGGQTISNFNASVRIGTGSETAGQLTAGLNTATYSVSQELNGIHLARPNLDSGVFYWRAPEPAVGPVRLYLAGEQGTTRNGPNSTIVLTANPVSAIAADAGGWSRPAVELAPTVVRHSATIRCNLPAAEPAALRVIDSRGRIAATVALPGGDAGPVSVAWRPYDADGRRLARGTYFVVLEAGGSRVVRSLKVQ